MRTVNAFRNAAISTVAQIVNMVLSVVCRTIFVHLLATEYLGLSGLFSNILSVLSLSELGIGNAIIINLYKPMAEQDEETICRYMNYYAKAYRFIGIAILLFGAFSTPWLHYLVNTDSDIPNLRFIYFLFVANSAVSYFCASRRTILTVDQKEYINTINRNVFLLIQNILQILVLLVTHNYILYVCMMLFCTVLSNVHIYFYTGKQYPYIKNKSPKLDKAQKKDLLTSMKAILLQKIGNVFVNSTDNIIISVILGVYWVGMYSNYSMIVGIITTFSVIAFAACSASIGNLNAEATVEKVHGIFKVMTLLSIWVYGFCSICFMCLFQPFIELWIGSEYLLSMTTVAVVVLAFFIRGIVTVTATFLDVTKLFINTRWVPFIMAVINIAVSVVGAYYWGLAGVFAGTVISYSVTQLWINPLILYKRKFQKSPWSYVLYVVPRLAVLVFAGFITYLVAGLIDNFLLKTLVCLIVPNTIMLFAWFGTDEVRYLRGVAKNVFLKKLTK